MSEKVSAGQIVRTVKPSARILHTRSGVSQETVLSKMIRDTSAHSRARGDSAYLGNYGYLHEVSDMVSTNIEDALNLNQMQPEVEICIQIMTAMVLRPKDMLTIELTHKVKPNILPAEMTAEMLAVVKHNVENNHNIKAKLPEKLRKALFTDGACITAIIPENSLDDLINGRANKKITLEHFQQRKSALKDIAKPVGYLGNPNSGQRRAGHKITLEDLMGGSTGEVKPPEQLNRLNVGIFSKVTGFTAPELYDNPAMLKLEDIANTATAVRQRTILENMGGSSYSDIESLYHQSHLRPEDIATVARQEEASRPAVGAPLIKEIPPEAGIPVFRPGRPEQIIGLLVLLDEFGSCISRATRVDYFDSLSTSVFNNRNALSGLLSQAATQMDAEDQRVNYHMTQQAAAAWRDIATRDIESRCLAGSVGNVTVGRQQLAYDLMLERAFANKQTRIVYIPADMLVYWAYRFNDNGTGRSLLEENKIISAIRALTLFMNVETMLRNSIDHRTLNITVDEDDPNKSRTKEMILHEYARQRYNSIPWATSNPRRMIEMAQQSGLAVSVKGGDNYPGTEVSIESRDIPYREVNLEMDEDLRKRQTMGYGLAPEIVDLSTQIEFSSKIATSNELSLKRALMIQDQTNHFIRQEAIKTSISDQTVMDQLRAIVGKHVKALGKPEEVAKLGVDHYVQLFFGIYMVELPRPNTGLESRLSELDEYLGGIDKLLDNILSDDLLAGEALGETSAGWVGIVKASVKSTLTLRWCRDNSVMPELTDLFKNDTPEDSGSVMIKEGLDNTSRLAKIIQGVGLSLYSAAIISENQWATLKERMDQARVEGTGESTDGFGGGSSDDGSSEGGGDDFGLDDGGSDDFNFDDDTGGSDEGGSESENTEDNTDNTDNSDTGGEEENTDSASDTDGDNKE